MQEFNFLLGDAAASPAPTALQSVYLRLIPLLILKT